MHEFTSSQMDEWTEFHLYCEILPNNESENTITCNNVNSFTKCKEIYKYVQYDYNISILEMCIFENKLAHVTCWC